MDVADYRELVALVAEHQRRLSTSAWWFDGNDRLRITSFNSATGVTLAIEGRRIDSAGQTVPFAERHVPNTDRTVATDSFEVGEGFLLGLQVRASGGTPRRGQCYVLVDVVRGKTGAVVPLGIVVKGYVADTTPLVWPGQPSQDSSEGPGVLRSITGTDPAAGVEISETVPTNTRWRLLALQTLFVTSAAAANRFPNLILDDGVTTVFQTDAPAAQAASITRRHVTGPGMARLTEVAGVAHWPLPTTVLLPGGARIRTSTTNLQAGDDYGAPQLLVEEWIED